LKGYLDIDEPMSKFSKLSSLAKLTDTGFVWAKYGGKLGFRDLASSLDSLALYTVAYGLTQEYFPNTSIERIKRYLKIRRLPDTEGEELIGPDRVVYPTKADVVVRSFSKDKWPKKSGHLVSTINHVPEDASPEKKFESGEKIAVSCGCSRGESQPFYRPSISQLAKFGINLSPQTLGSRPFDAVYCTHVEIDHNWLSQIHNIHGFGLNLPDSEAVKILEYVLNQVVDSKMKWISKYRLNEQFSKEEMELFSRLIVGSKSLQSGHSSSSQSPS
jgi:hypothetical protein